MRKVGDFLYVFFHQATWPTGGHHPAVICFFVLSGFCIHFPFENRAETGPVKFDWPNYFRRRFWRIMPVYWTASLAGLALIAADKWIPSGSLLLQLHTQATPMAVGVRFAGLAGIYPREIFAGNYILNTVAVEMLMYGVYPWFIRYAARRAWGTLMFFFGLAYCSTIPLVQFATPYWVFNSVFMLGLFWFLGAYAAHLFVVYPRRISGVYAASSWVAFIALEKLPHFYGLNLIIQLAWGLVCMLGILWLLGRERHQLLAPSALTRSVFHFASKVSYSLYAVHTPAMMLATWALLVFAHSQSYRLQLAAGLSVSVAATLATYYGVERVFYRPRN